MMSAPERVIAVCGSIGTVVLWWYGGARLALYVGYAVVGSPLGRLLPEAAFFAGAFAVAFTVLVAEAVLTFLLAALIIRALLSHKFEEPL
jgi:hypothetical protein